MFGGLLNRRGKIFIRTLAVKLKYQYMLKVLGSLQSYYVVLSKDLKEVYLHPLLHALWRIRTEKS